MKSSNHYGQYCPLAMASEFLCNRWTVIVLREILFGSTSFNDICRGVPRMSRTLLSNRLKELVGIGVLLRVEGKSANQVNYHLTKAGEALGGVVMAMGSWGQEWLKIEPSIEEIDVNLLMWDIRRSAKSVPELPDPFVVHFFLNDVPENKAEHWLVFEKNEVDLCHINKGFKVDVTIDISSRTLTKVWMGWEDFSQALKKGEIILEGPKEYTKIAEIWLGHSVLAHIKKQPIESRVGKVMPAKSA